VADPLEELDMADPNYEEFARIFGHFQPTEEEISEMKIESQVEGGEQNEQNQEPEPEVKQMSKKEKKRLKRISVAVLKQLVRRPDVVESWDVTAADPRLLVHLKSYKNTVPVPRHWNQKRKYLQGKRGVEKTPFDLPEFIAATGISKIRAAIQEKEDNKKLKKQNKEKKCNQN